MNKIAKVYYEQKGFSLVEESYVCEAGYIDLIFKKDILYIFVEITNKKVDASKILKVAELYLQKNEIHEFLVEVDKFSIIQLNKNNYLIHKEVISLGTFI